MLAVRWRGVAGVVCCAVAAWSAWFTADILREWFTTALVLAVPALIVVVLAPAWRSGALVTGVLLAGLVMLVVVSTRRPGALRPPQTDWLLPYLALAVGAWATAYAVRVRRASPDQRKTLLQFGAGGIVVLLCVGVILAGGPGGALPGSGEDLGVDRNDLLPFPAALDSGRIGMDCQTGTGVCTEVLEVWNPAGRPPGDVAEQLVQHLRAKGWPMASDGNAGQFTGCQPMRGVFGWAEQVCASTIPAQNLSWPSDVRHRDDSVVLSIAASPDAIPWQPA